MLNYNINLKYTHLVPLYLSKALVRQMYAHSPHIHINTRIYIKVCLEWCLVWHLEFYLNSGFSFLHTAKKKKTTNNNNIGSYIVS